MGSQITNTKGDNVNAEQATQKGLPLFAHYYGKTLEIRTSCAMYEGILVERHTNIGKVDARVLANKRGAQRWNF